MSAEVIALKTRIRDLREDHDLSQKDVADYELGNLNVPLPVLHALADFYKTSIDYITGRTDEVKPYPKAK